MCALNRSGHHAHAINLATGVGPARGQLLADTWPPQITGFIRTTRLSLRKPTTGVPRTNLYLPGEHMGEKGLNVLE